MNKDNVITAGLVAGAAGAAILVGSMLAKKDVSLQPTPTGACGPNSGQTSCNQGATCKLANGQTGLCGPMAASGGCPCEQLNSTSD